MVHIAVPSVTLQSDEWLFATVCFYMPDLSRIELVPDAFINLSSTRFPMPLPVADPSNRLPM